MITKVQKWGNSQGLRISKDLLADADIEVGDAVDVAVCDGALVVTPVRRVRGGVALEDLVREIPGDYKPEAVDWGPPVGRALPMCFTPRAPKSIDFTCSTMTSPVTSSPAGIETWKGKPRAVLVTGHAMQSPVRLLNKSLLTTSAGRRPRCS